MPRTDFMPRADRAYHHPPRSVANCNERVGRLPLNGYQKLVIALGALFGVLVALVILSPTFLFNKLKHRWLRRGEARKYARQAAAIKRNVGQEFRP